MQVNLYSFRKKVSIYKNILRRFLTKLEKQPPSNLDTLAEKVNAEVWQEIDCLTCSNCCRRMTPTFNTKDIIRISAHLSIRPKDFKEKYLHKEPKDKDWVNNLQPCQFLNLQTNMCSIYEVRPDDCAGFPHLTKKKTTDYMHIHKQNIAYCPATFKFVEKMLQQVKFK